MGTASAWRMLLCHKHPVSARLHFLTPQGAGVVLPHVLPELVEFAEQAQADKVQVHPASALRELQQALALTGSWQWLDEFQLVLQAPRVRVPIYLAALAGYDLCTPPAGTRWIGMTASIGMPWLDRELLRRAYEVLIG